MFKMEFVVTLVVVFTSQL